MATVRRSSAREVVAALQTELALHLGWQALRIPVVAGGDTQVPHRLGDQEVIIRVLGEEPDRGVIDGAGRVSNRRTRRLQVECRTRLILDRDDEDLQRLTHSSVGHIELEDAVCDCLETFFPVDESGDALVGQPVRCHGLSDPRPDRDAREWVSSKWSVEFLYDRDLDQTR